MKTSKKEEWEQGKERRLLPSPGASEHSPSLPVSWCKPSRRSLWKCDLHPITLKLVLTFFSFPTAHTEATARFYRSTLTIAYLSVFTATRFWQGQASICNCSQLCPSGEQGGLTKLTTSYSLNSLLA